MDDNSLQFAQPVWILAGLIVCAGIIALFIRFDRRRDADLAKLVHPRFRQRLTEGFSPRLRNLKRGMWLLAVLLVFIAVARPQKGYEWREAKLKGIDILFAVDTSRSMLAEDLSPNRLERARLGILDFVAKLEGDRVGLIPFAGSAFALCPLTLDYDAFRESLNALDTDLIPRQGTDLASAVKEAERLFDESGNNHRVLVLLTDGEDLQGAVDEAVKAATKKQMAVYTVGVGSPEGATIPIRHPNGRTDYVRDEKGEIVRTSLDESTLRKIADKTRALYVPLGRGAEGLDTIYQEKLRLIPPSERNQRMQRIPLERFEWPLGAAIILLIVEFFIRDRKKPRVPGKAPVAAKAFAVPVVTVMLSGMNGIRAAEEVVSSQDPRLIYNQGTEAYAKGDFSKAAESLRTSLRTADLSLQQRSYYNLGNSLYRTGQGTLEKDPEKTIKTWEESIKAYQDALALNESDDDARFNKALVEKKLEDLKKQQNKDDKNQKDQQEDKDQKDPKDKKEDKDQKGQKDGDDGKDPKESKDQKQSKEGDDPKDGKDGGKPEDGKDPKEGEKPGEEKDSGDSKQGKEPKDGKDDSKEKSDQESAEGKEGEEESQQGKEGSTAEQRERKEEMTPEEARQLLEALRADQRTVIPIPQQRRSRFITPDNSTKGKTW